MNRRLPLNRADHYRFGVSAPQTACVVSVVHCVIRPRPVFAAQREGPLLPARIQSFAAAVVGGSTPPEGNLFLTTFNWQRLLSPLVSDSIPISAQSNERKLPLPGNRLLREWLLRALERVE